MDLDIGDWPSWKSPAQAGWSADGLARAREIAAGLQTAAVLVVAGGRVVDGWGEVSRRYNVHSIRKSLLSALIGIHAEAGRFDPWSDLAALGIDDRLGLSEREKLATAHDLLCARSGVYHPSGYESAWMLAIKPARHSAGPGTTWCYNNWDFNALGTIFRRATGADIHEDFAARIAAPLGMQDFVPGRDGEYIELEASEHPAYPFRMTARDMARFGELFLRRGRWQDQQIVPADWVAQSTAPISEAGARGAYGYMWWVSRAGLLFPGSLVPEGTYSANGAGGHYIVVVPALEAVVVHRVDTDVAGRSVDGAQFGRLLGAILAAAG